MVAMSTWGIYQVFDLFNIKTCHTSATAWHDISLLLRVIEQTLHSASSYIRHTGQQQAERHVASSVTAAASSAGHALYLQHAAVVSGLVSSYESSKLAFVQPCG